jgi:hypothetical protein
MPTRLLRSAGIPPLCFGSLLIAGCASTQINYDTLDIASTYDQLITKQVTFNIQKSLDNPNGIPAFVKVSNQTTTTQNTFTPTLTLPLSSQISTVANVGATGLGTGGSKTSQFAGKSLSLTGTDQWNQTYTLTPVFDPDQLRRLRALYQYVTGKLSEQGADADKELEALYPIIQTVGSGAANAATSKTTLSITVAGKPISIAQSNDNVNTEKKTLYVRRTYRPPKNGLFNGYTWSLVTPDVTFITQPGCILCDYENMLTSEELSQITDTANKDKYATAHKLQKNIQLRNDWLYLPGEKPAADAVPLPSAGLVDTLFLKKIVNNDPDGGRKYFYEFVLFNEQATSQGTGSASSGGQSLGRKTTPVQNISIPVGGVVPLQ